MSKKYSFTKAGREIATQAGLDDLVSEVYDEDRVNALVAPVIDEHGPFHDEHEHDLALAEVTSKIYAAAEDYNERLQIARAAMISTDNTWQYYTGGVDSEGRLFAVDGIDVLYKATPNLDPEILTGAIGHNYADKQAVKRLLTPDVFGDYGFDNKTDAASFVGAYIVSKLDERILGDEESTYTYIEGGLEHKVGVGGSFHGDFRMYDKVTPVRGVITPNGRKAEFAPVTGEGVAGYHSVEPDITVAMLKAEFYKNGLIGMQELVQEFGRVVEDFYSEAETSDNKPFVAAFADYGDGDAEHLVRSLQYMIENADKSRGGVKSFLRAPYLPGLDVMFEIIPSEDGVVLRNTQNDEIYNSINIRREHYAKLFRSLLGQSVSGLGRTAPQQHIELVNGLAECLEEKT